MTKGVLVVNPKISKVIFRHSMKKYEIPFPSLPQTEIEVIRYSKSIPTFLNREFIPLFSYLGVPEKTFFALQDDAIQKALSKDLDLGTS